MSWKGERYGFQANERQEKLTKNLFNTCNHN